MNDCADKGIFLLAGPKSYRERLKVELSSLPPTLTTPRCQPLGSEVKERLSRIVSGELETTEIQRTKTENHFLLS